MVLSVSQKVFSEVQSRADKPFGAGKLAQIIDYCTVFFRSFYFAEFPHGYPEVWYVFNRPLVQFIIRVDSEIVFLIDRVDEFGYVGLFSALFRRHPKRFSHPLKPRLSSAICLCGVLLNIAVLFKLLDVLRTENTTNFILFV